MNKINLNKIITEQQNKATVNIDIVDTLAMLRMINQEDIKVALAIKKCLPVIARAIDMIATSIKNKGRLIYIGAGTSGRLGILDASEMPPTFGVNKNLVVGLIAGGDKAIKDPVEGAEDNQENAIRDLKKIKLSKKDVLVGLSASGRTPYVKSALIYANKIGAQTIGISTNFHAEINKVAKIKIEAIVGPEVVTGSTRMKSGTAQKMILNMLSTGAMIKLGKVYGNLMVDVQPTNKKLIVRAQRIVKTLTNADDILILKTLKIAKWQVKPSVVMIKKHVGFKEAINLLNKFNGSLKRIIG